MTWGGGLYKKKKTQKEGNKIGTDMQFKVNKL